VVTVVDGNSKGAKLGDGRGQVVMAGAGVRRVDLCPLPGEEARDCPTAARESDDRYFTRQPQTLPPWLRTRHRILSVAIARSADRIPMIQNRTTTCGSLHPFISK
jgi:hypothetical protein